MNFTPVYRLPFVKAGESVTEAMERTRYMTIDRQLESLFTFLGDGVMTGWEIVEHPTKDNAIVLREGSGVADSIAVATNIEYSFDLQYSLSGDSIYYVYVRVNPNTPYTAAGEALVSQTLYETPAYLILGKVTISNQGQISNIDMSEESGRTDLTFLNYLISSIAAHVHTGAPGEPSKIDLYNHVKGILSAAHIQDLPASKVTSGIFDKERFRLSHGDLEDIGILTHSQLDSLISKFQNVNKLLFGDLMTSNLIQLILSLKHVWGDVDEYFYNFFALIPGIDNNRFLNTESFIDFNASDAEIDFLNHRIRGVYVPSKEIGQYVINSVQEFSYDGDGNISYDPIYISISGFDSQYGYGYGYGFGEGLDYFDVLLGSYDGSDSLTVGVTGTEVGYGIGDFESLFSGTYGWGYGYEQLSGFTTTLTSTRVTLVPDSSSKTLHDKDIDEGGITLSDNHYISYVRDSYRSTPYGQSTPNRLQFLVMASDNSDVYGKRGINSSLYSFSSDTDKSTYIHFIDADQSSVCLFWSYSEALDMSVDDYMYFVFAQTRYRRGSDDSLQEIPGFVSYTSSGSPGGFDPYWSPDVSADLIIEGTLYRGGDYYRTFYLYTEDGESTTKFISATDNSFFENNRYYPEGYEYGSDVPALARIQAQINSSNLTWIGAYKVDPGSETLSLAEAQDQITLATSASIINNNSIKLETIRNITGVYLYTKNDSSYLFDFSDDLARSLYFPMGKRNTEAKSGEVYYGTGLKEENNPEVMDRSYEDGISSYKESTMLVDIDSIYVGGTPGYRYNPSNNVVSDLTISFPDPVNLTSISWISEEPSDSIVYILVKRLDSLDGVDSVYNENCIFTNKGTELNNAQLINESTGKADNPTESSWISSPINPLVSDYDIQMASKYRVSGSDFPSEYNAVRTVSFKVVLLPSSDLNVAPSLNSITINYTSNTERGDLVVSTEDQWSNYRSQSSITKGTSGGVDYVTIDMPTNTNTAVGKVKNMIYGTNGAVIEVGNSNGTWLDTVKSFTGSGPGEAYTLPLTTKQNVSNGTYGISGYVTNLQKRKNGNIVFLDQDSSRIIELDMNYRIQRIIASEYAYKNTTETWMPEGLSESDRRGQLLRAIYNPDIGDNGVLYLVFSHELKAWDALYSQTIDQYVSEYDPTDSGYVDLSMIKMVVQATDVDFTDCTVYAVDRGVLCIELSEAKNNYIYGNLANEIKYLFNTELKDIVLEDGGNPVQTRVAVDETTGNSCVVFKDNVMVKHGVSRTTIEKPDYSVIFSPIQGIVAFDVDDDEMYYILKRPRPYSYGDSIWTDYDENTHLSEPWYVKMSGVSLWKGWTESTKDHTSLSKNVIPVLNFRTDSSWEPDFYTNGIYGYRGSIQKKDDYLLMCISGEKDLTDSFPNGVFIFSKETGSSSGHLYGGPEDFDYVFNAEDDYYVGTYPMSARFDPVTYDSTNKDYGSIYIAISDLKKSSSIDSKSEAIKVNPNSRKITWQWGTKTDKDNGVSNSFALVVNDINTLSYNDNEVIIST
jgi:hypothetical protein